MIFNFVPMTEEYAREMIDNWKYDGQYSIYNYENEEELLLNKSIWGKGIFAVLNEKNELIGEVNIEFFDEKDEYIDYKNLDDEKKETAEMWFGFGLKPELTGKGIGKDFAQACVNFAKKKNDYKGNCIRLGVAEFNKRAIKVYERAGFEKFNTHQGEIAGEKIDIIWMKKKI